MATPRSVKSITVRNDEGEDEVLIIDDPMDGYADEEEEFISNLYSSAMMAALKRSVAKLDKVKSAVRNTEESMRVLAEIADRIDSTGKAVDERRRTRRQRK